MIGVSVRLDLEENRCVVYSLIELCQCGSGCRTLMSKSAGWWVVGGGGGGTFWVPNLLELKAMRQWTDSPWYMV